MGLNLETFSNVHGGQALFKALGHPLAAAPARGLVDRLAAAGPLAVYDPLGHMAAFAELYDISTWDLGAIYVQRVEDVGRERLGRQTQPITALAGNPAVSGLLVAAFDASRLVAHIQHLVPHGVELTTFDVLRLPQQMLTNPRHYLDPLNFATNFAFLRDAAGHHTRITLCNYWSGYGAQRPALWLRLFDSQGAVLAQWEESLPASAALVVIDSLQVRERFGLSDFTGSLFIHALNIAGHDVIKYALDTYGDDVTKLSCTHDANAWPAECYAGLPAPAQGESVVLWVQNSHPTPIAPNEVGLSEMGSSEVRWLDTIIPPFATYPLDVAALLPTACWPVQMEIHAGKHFVRPRYEVASGDTRRSRIAHANVERVDLQPDRRLCELEQQLGKGYLLPAPVLPLERWDTLVLPTPMASDQAELPLAVVLYDANGEQILRHRLGKLARHACPAVAVDALLAETGVRLPSGHGHLELIYDFGEGGEADGWLHALFRYRDRHSNHVAESSFGAHLYNIPLTYRNEPQSYTGPAPGLSTRLFLRLGPPPLDTLCQLIYPSSKTWHATSSTRLILHERTGAEVASRSVEIPCNGSLLWRYTEMFDAAQRAQAGDHAYVMVRDTTCRLFGYHGLLNDHGAFSLDHMFGF